MSESVHAIRTIDIDADALTLTLSNGRVLREPLKRHVRLEKQHPQSDCIGCWSTTAMSLTGPRYGPAPTRA